ncbi:hypothetical protein GCM10009647_066680 [Streptomyces sanglieri]
MAPVEVAAQAVSPAGRVAFEVDGRVARVAFNEAARCRIRATQRATNLTIVTVAGLSLQVGAERDRLGNGFQVTLPPYELSPKR